MGDKQTSTLTVWQRTDKYSLAEDRQLQSGRQADQYV